jgi:nicotinate-nucleotide adenylyltransferase
MIARRIAIYGGAFDPFHNGHIATIALILNARVVDQVLVVPSGERPDKPAHVAASHRLKMVQLGVHECFAHDPRVIISELHLSGGIGSATIDLLRHLRHQEPSAECKVVIGEELVQDLPRWRESESLRQMAHFLVLPRPGALALVQPEGWQIERIHPPYQAGVLVSSTTVRSILAQGLSPAGFLPATVAAYCRQHQLYQVSDPGGADQHG